MVQVFVEWFLDFPIRLCEFVDAFLRWTFVAQVDSRGILFDQLHPISERCTYEFFLTFLNN